jgi:hypothetical protein
VRRPATEPFNDSGDRSGHGLRQPTSMNLAVAMPIRMESSSHAARAKSKNRIARISTHFIAPVPKPEGCPEGEAGSARIYPANREPSDRPRERLETLRAGS